MDDLLTEPLTRQLAPYLPAGTAAICANWLTSSRVQLRISRPRKTKLGDFRPAQYGKPHRISVNADLEPLQFLITFAHEIAHVQTWDTHGRKVAPHGQEWKSCYREKLQNLLALNVLDNQTAAALYQHSLHPKASSTTDTTLQKLTYPAPAGDILNNLAQGAVFKVKDGRIFKTIKKLRKYWLCEELSTRRHYRVLGTLSVTTPDDPVG